ncbi:MAG: hypothetical protein ACXVBK_14855 [Flavisolibacter sp.]
MNSIFRTDLAKKTGLVITLTGILVLGAVCPISIKLKSFDAVGFQTLIASLLVVALFLERGVEVFVAAWRDPEAEDIRAGRLSINKEIEQLKKDKQDVEAAISELKQAGKDVQKEELARKDIIDSINQKELEICENEKQEIVYGSGTKRFALYFALGAGLLISAVGIRVLGTLVDISNEQAMTGDQRIAFQIVDIALTGGLLAGGSEAFHRLAALYNTFLDASIKKVDKQPT